MNFLRSTLICLAIASLLVSDVVIAVHSVHCGRHSDRSALQVIGGEEHSCCHHHCENQEAASPDDSAPAAPEHDKEHCAICRAALLCQIALLSDGVLAPAFEDLELRVVLAEATRAPSREFLTALSERGPPA